jgi:hypothetical protein
MLSCKRKSTVGYLGLVVSIPALNAGGWGSIPSLIYYISLCIVYKKTVLVPYSQHSIFFLTYAAAQKAGLFHHTKLERLTSDEHSNLSIQFLSYEENEVL